MADLRSFSFARFQGRYFRFMLPTFETSFTEPLVAPLLEENCKKRFHNGGVVGLVILDHSMDALRKFHRPTIAGHLQDWGRRAVARPRAGSGISGALVGYRELNDVVSHALESLGRREAKREKAV